MGIMKLVTVHSMWALASKHLELEFRFSLILAV